MEFSIEIKNGMIGSHSMESWQPWKDPRGHAQQWSQFRCPKYGSQNSGMKKQKRIGSADAAKRYGGGGGRRRLPLEALRPAAARLPVHPLREIPPSAYKLRL